MTTQIYADKSLYSLYTLAGRYMLFTINTKLIDRYSKKQTSVYGCAQVKFGMIWHDVQLTQ